MKRSPILSLICLLAFSCTTTPPSPEALKVKEADASMIVGCEFLGTVDSIAMWGMTPKDGINRARNGAKANAYKLGATHIVFDPVDPREAAISGKAYRCGEK